MEFGLTEVLNIIAAMSAIGTAAFGLVDTTKAFWGGVSNIGFAHLERCLNRFDKTLSAALGGADWRDVFRAHWRNGVAKADQKAIVRSLIRLGMTDGAIDELAIVGNVEKKLLRELVDHLRNGTELEPRHLNALGRVDTAMEALIDAAYERADHQYRNGARALAGAVAIALSLAGGWFVLDYGQPVHLAMALAVGILAVPVAPIAKDLTASLTTAARSLSVLRGSA